VLFHNPNVTFYWQPVVTKLTTSLPLTIFKIVPLLHCMVLLVSYLDNSFRLNKQLKLQAICAFPFICKHSLFFVPVNPDWFYLPGFTFLVLAPPGSPGQNPESLKRLLL